MVLHILIVRFETGRSQIHFIAFNFYLVHMSVYPKVSGLSR